MQTDKTDQGERRPPRGPDKACRAKSRTLAAAEFEAVRPFLRISGERIEAARLAMVEGHKLADIAKSYGWESRQAVSRAVDAVWSAYKTYQESRSAQEEAAGLPEGWEQITIAAPKELIAKFRAQVAEAKKPAMKNKKGEA